MLDVNISVVLGPEHILSSQCVFFDYLCCKSKGAKKMRQNVQHLLIFTVVFVQLPKDVSFKANVNQERSMHFHWSAGQISRYWGFLKLNCFADE